MRQAAPPVRTYLLFSSDTSLIVVDASKARIHSAGPQMKHPSCQVSTASDLFAKQRIRRLGLIQREGEIQVQTLGKLKGQLLSSIMQSN